MSTDQLSLTSHAPDLRERQAAATALVSMYRAGRPDPEQRQRVLAERGFITQSQEDRERSSDCVHVDEGVGVEFPL